MPVSKSVGSGAQRLMRTRLGLPLLLACLAGVAAVNEATFQHSNETLTRGIALTDARIEAAVLQQRLTDMELSAVSFLATRNPVDLQRFEDKSRQVPERLQSTLQRITAVDPQGLVAVEPVRRRVAERIATLGNWVDRARLGEQQAALELVAADSSQAAFDSLRLEVEAMLQQAADVQSAVRINLFSAMGLSRLSVHVMALLTAVWLMLFAWQLRRSDTTQIQAQQDLQTQVDMRTAQLSDLATYLVGAREQERAKVARELHDELGGLLTSIKLEFARVRRLPDQSEPLQQRLKAIEARLNEGIALKRRMIESLRPSSLEQLGLVPSLQLLFADQSELLGIPLHTELAEVELSKEVELSVYRLVQEALTNAGKYAQATAIQVELKPSGDSVHVAVQDDGRGFNIDSSRVGHHGISGMDFRIRSHQGTLTVTSAPGQGTRIEALLPSSRDEPAAPADSTAELTADSPLSDLPSA